ncbi:MAG TPA: hypothetical protein VNA28_17515 [Solirubrobacteraceae bacterium]|nr:hypothetical protein [Solirubrobacteraceae bacterium]
MTTAARPGVSVTGDRRFVGRPHTDACAAVLERLVERRVGEPMRGISSREQLAGALRAS